MNVVPKGKRGKISATVQEKAKERMQYKRIKEVSVVLQMKMKQRKESSTKKKKE